MTFVTCLAPLVIQSNALNILFWSTPVFSGKILIPFCRDTFWDWIASACRCGRSPSATVAGGRIEVTGRHAWVKWPESPEAVLRVCFVSTFSCCASSLQYNRKCAGVGGEHNTSALTLIADDSLGNPNHKQDEDLASVQTHNYTMTDYESIKRKCLQAGTLFEDPDFPANSSSLYHQAPWSTPLIEWKRPKVRIISVHNLLRAMGCVPRACTCTVSLTRRVTGGCARLQ